MPDRPRSLRFAVNLVWSLWGVVTLAGLSFLLLPYLVRGLGLEGYALYALMGTVAAYLALLSMGAGNATVKFVAELAGKGDGAGLGRVLRTSLTLHLVPVAAGAALVCAARGWLAAGFFQVSPAAQADAAFLLGCAALGAVFFSLTQFGVSVFHGLQRFGLANGLQVLQTAFVLGGSAVLVRLGCGLRALGLLFIGVHLGLCAVSLALAARALPRPEGGTPDGGKEFARYGFKAFLSQLAWSVTFQWDRLIIGSALPLSSLTYYLVPSAILQRLWVLPQSVTASVFPMLSEMGGRGEAEALHRAYRQLSRLVLWLLVPGFVCLAMLAPQLLTLWMGEAFSAHGVWPLRFLAAGYFFNLLASMPSTAALGLGRPGLNAAWLGAQAALCVAGWLILIPRYGIAGAAGAFALAQAVTDLPYCWLVSRDLFGMPFGEYLGSVVARPVAAGAALALALWPARPYIAGWGSLLAAGAASAAAYYALAFALLEAPEREAVGKLRASALARRAG